MEAARGQKHPSEAKNGMKESIYGKKCLMKVSHQPQKPPSGSNQIWATTSDKKDTATDLRGHCIRLCSCCCYQTYQSKVATYVHYICCCCCAVVNNNLIEVGSFDNMSQETHTKEKGLEFYLINNRRMFNVEIDDLAEKPYPRARALRSLRSGIPSFFIRLNELGRLSN